VVYAKVTAAGRLNNIRVIGGMQVTTVSQSTIVAGTEPLRRLRAVLPVIGV
jgi:hypothetical protein